MVRRVNLIDIAIIILFILAVYFIFTRILGHSASDLTIIVTLFTLLAGALYRLNREFGELKIKTVNSFDRLKNDMNLIKKRLKVQRR